MNKQTGAQTKEKRKGKINVQMHRKETRNKQTKYATNSFQCADYLFVKCRDL